MNDLLIEFAAWLSDFYLLSTILLAAVLVAGKVVGQPARRIAIAWAAALGLVVLAGLCAVPDWSTFHVNRPAPLSAAAIESSNLSPVEMVSPTLPTPTIEIPVLEERSEFVAPSIAVAATRPVDWGKIAVLLMASGSAVILLWLAAGAWQALRLRRRAIPASAALATMLAELTPEGQTAPKLAVLADLPVAVAIGVRRPMILLPTVLADMSRPEKLRSVLAHELAHVEHRDLWLLALMRGLLVVLWAHPLVWLWRRQVRLDQETLADVAAAEVTCRSDYAEQLVALARVATEARTPRLATSVGLWENASQLKRRVAVLLDEKLTVLRSCSRCWRVACVLSIALIALGLSLITLQPENIAVAEQADKHTAIEDQAEGGVKKFDDGATVKVLAIGTHDEEPQRWWNVLGRPMDSVPFGWRKAGDVSGPDGAWRRVVIRVDDLQEDAEVTWKIVGTSGASAGGVVTVDGERNPEGYFTRYFSISSKQKAFGLRVGVAAGPWKAVVKHSLTGPAAFGLAKNKSLVFSEAVGTAKGTLVVISHNYFDQNFRVVAIDKQSKVHDTAGRGGFSAGKIYQTRSRFLGLSPADIDRFEFQVRDYQWVEFNELPSGPQAELGATTRESGKTAPTARLQVREVWTKETATIEKAALEEEEIVSVKWSPGLGRTETLLYQRDGDILFDESDVLEAEVLFKLGEKNRFDIQLKLSPAAGKRLSLATKRLMGKRLAMLFDGKVIFAPTIRSVIGENVRTNASFSKQEAEELARVLGWAKLTEKAPSPQQEEGKAVRPAKDNPPMPVLSDWKARR